MRPKLALIALGFAAAGVTATAAYAAEPTTRTICLNGQKTIEVTPDNEDTIGEPYTLGPCPTTTTGTGRPTTTVPMPPTTKPGTPIVTLCTRGNTTTGPKGSANPTGHLYPEGPCPVAPPAVKATPNFTG